MGSAKQERPRAWGRMGAPEAGKGDLWPVEDLDAKVPQNSDRRQKSKAGNTCRYFNSSVESSGW